MEFTERLKQCHTYSCNQTKHAKCEHTPNRLRCCNVSHQWWAVLCSDCADMNVWHYTVGSGTLEHNCQQLRQLGHNYNTIQYNIIAEVWKNQWHYKPAELLEDNITGLQWRKQTKIPRNNMKKTTKQSKLASYPQAHSEKHTNIIVLPFLQCTMWVYYVKYANYVYLWSLVLFYKLF